MGIKDGDIRTTERKLEARRMDGIQKAQLMDVLRQATGVSTEVADLHHALRCHFHWEDRYSPTNPHTGLPKTDVIEEADFDPTAQQDSELAHKLKAVLDRYHKIGVAAPGFARVVWEIAREDDNVPTITGVAAASTIYGLAQTAQRIHWIARLKREEMDPDCLACTKDQPCEACLQTARIVGMLEGGL